MEIIPLPNKPGEVWIPFMPRKGPFWLTPAYRIVLFLYVQSLPISNASSGNSYFDPQYLTHWGVIFTQIYSTLGIIFYFMQYFWLSDSQKRNSWWVTAFDIIYCLCYSTVLTVFILYWAFLRDDWSYFSIGAHLVLALLIYLPFLWEYIVLRIWNLFIVLAFGICYGAGNLIYVKSGNPPSYSILPWDNVMSWVYLALALVLIVGAFLLGWWFGKIIKRSERLTEINADQENPYKQAEVNDSGVGANHGGDIELTPKDEA